MTKRRYNNSLNFIESGIISYLKYEEDKKKLSFNLSTYEGEDEEGNKDYSNYPVIVSGEYAKVLSNILKDGDVVLVRGRCRTYKLDDVKRFNIRSNDINRIRKSTSTSDDDTMMMSEQDILNALQ